MINCADDYTSLGTPSLPSHFFAAGGERGGGHAEERGGPAEERGGHAEGQRLDIGNQALAHRLLARYATSALN